MTAITLLVAILLANPVKPAQTSVTSDSGEVNTLPTADVFTTQIRQIPTTSEEAPEAASGNNLNNAAAFATSHLLGENFQPISTIFTPKEKKAKSEGVDGGNVELMSQSNKTVPEDENTEATMSESLPLVWENCHESTFKETVNNDPKPSTDIEKTNQEQISKAENSLWSASLSKRDSSSNNTEGIKAWLEKYNNLKLNKKEEKPQQKPETILVRKNVQSTSGHPSSIQVIPITREIFQDNKDIVNNTFDVTVTENDIFVKASYTEDWFEVKDPTKIRFGRLPQVTTYMIPSLKLESGFYPFSFMSDFFAFIYPFDFPIGLIMDIVWGEFSFPNSFLQSIKIESTFLVFIVIFGCFALIIPSYLLILGILALCSKSACDDETEDGALFPEAKQPNCTGRILVVLTLFIVMICCVLLSGMAVSNEQAFSASDQSRNVISCACADIATWLSSAARELHLTLVPPVDLVIHAYKEDFKNIDPLLGEPIQEAIASESGVDMVLDSLADIVSECEDLSTKISSLRDISARAGALATSASDRIKDLSRQLDNLKKYCIAKDAPLCDTISTNSLEMKMKFEAILREQQLLELRSLGVENLTRAILTAKQEFKSLPSAISAQTLDVREGIVRHLEHRRLTVHMTARVLNDIARHLTAGLHSFVRQVENGLRRIQEYEFWRWTTMFASILTFTFVMLLILLALMCSCGSNKIHAKRTLQLSAFWLCLASLVLWTVISVIFLVAGHAEVYICNALWDKPQFSTLSALLDRPSPLMVNNDGVFDALFRELDNVTVDVSIRDVLRDCEMNRPAYTVFQLDKIIDVNKVTSYFEWEEIQGDLRRFSSSIDVGFLKTISAYFSKLLNDMMVVSDVDLSRYRMDYNGPLIGKDLPSLVDQLENLSAKVTDLSTAGRFETLAKRTQRLHLTGIQPLEQLRADMVYKLTELELQLMPFRRKLNISLSHIHTAQYYIDNQGDIIAQKKVSGYIAQLLSHTANWRTHVLTATGQNAAKCGPLFQVFSAARALLCTRYVSSLHGWWVCGFLLGVAWCALLLPLLVQLWRTYGRKLKSRESLAMSNIEIPGTPTTVHCDMNNWNTPAPPEPPQRNDSW